MPALQAPVERQVTSVDTSADRRVGETGRSGCGSINQPAQVAPSASIHRRDLDPELADVPQALGRDPGLILREIGSSAEPRRAAWPRRWGQEPTAEEFHDHRFAETFTFLAGRLARTLDWPRNAESKSHEEDSMNFGVARFGRIDRGHLGSIGFGVVGPSRARGETCQAAQPQ
jgi:hypothetical protein